MCSEHTCWKSTDLQAHVTHTEAYTTAPQSRIWSWVVKGKTTAIVWIWNVPHEPHVLKILITTCGTLGRSWPTKRNGQGERRWIRRVYWGRWYWRPNAFFCVSLLPACHEVNRFSPPNALVSSCHPTARLKVLEPREYTLNILKPFTTQKAVKTGSDTQATAKGQAQGERPKCYWEVRPCVGVSWKSPEH